MIVAPCEVHKVHVGICGREKVVLGIDGRGGPCQDVFREDITGKVGVERAGAFALAGAYEAGSACRAGCDIVAIDKPKMRDSIGVQHILFIERRVVLDRHVLGRARIAQIDDKTAQGAPRGGKIFEDVVSNQHPLHVLADIGVVGGQDVQPCVRVPDDVFPEGHVLDRRPGGTPVLIAHRQEDGVAVLARYPRVLKDVSLEKNAARVFELEEVFDGP